ncbi:MAG: arginine--tRNA ligase [Pseudomonadota bacterium]
MKKILDQILRTALQNCFERGRFCKTSLPDYVIEVPNNPDHGHFATNLPLTLASSQKRRPVEIAKIIIENLNDDKEFFEKVEVAGPGFINFIVKTKEWHRVLTKIVMFKDDYGRCNLGNGERVLMEFVSANPTGPLHLGHGRGAAVGDTLCRILSFCGYNVIREFYINDSGQQVRLLGESIYSRWRQIGEPDYPFPENGYQGEYVLDLAKEISKEIGLNALPPDRAVTQCTEQGKKKMLKEIGRDLAQFGCAFDVWYRESDLYASGLLESSLEMIGRRGELYEKDGALWIKTSIFGDDKDRVIRKNDGQYTYFASDIAYHLDKWARKFSRAVNIWGADHHGYILTG